MLSQKVTKLLKEATKSSESSLAKSEGDKVS